MKNETKEEALENWYGWLDRRIYPAPHQKEYIKMAMKGLYEQAVESRISPSTPLKQLSDEEINTPFNGFNISVIENNVAASDGKAILMLSSNDYRNYKNKTLKNKEGETEQCKHEILNKGACAACDYAYVFHEDNSVSPVSQSDHINPIELLEKIKKLEQENRSLSKELDWELRGKWDSSNYPGG